MCCERVHIETCSLESVFQPDHPLTFRIGCRSVLQTDQETLNSKFLDNADIHTLLLEKLQEVPWVNCSSFLVNASEYSVHNSNAQQQRKMEPCFINTTGAEVSPPHSLPGHTCE